MSSDNTQNDSMEVDTIIGTVPPICHVPTSVEKEQAELFKTEGNELFNKNKFVAAREKYGQGG